MGGGDGKQRKRKIKIQKRWEHFAYAARPPANRTVANGRRPTPRTLQAAYVEKIHTRPLQTRLLRVGVGRGRVVGGGCMVKSNQKIKIWKNCGRSSWAEKGGRNREGEVAAKIILKMHCPKKGRNTNTHTRSLTLAQILNPRKKIHRIKKNVIIMLKRSAGGNVNIYERKYERICVNLSIYYIFKHLQNTTEKVSRCKICNLCEGIVPKSK